MNEKPDIKPGDEVRVLRHSRTRYDQTPDGGYTGTVVKVARKYATATYEVDGAERTVEFDISDGRERGVDSHYGWYVRTPEQVEAGQRRKAAVALLMEAGFEIRLGHHPDGELIERLAATVLDWAAEQTGRTGQ